MGTIIQLDEEKLKRASETIKEMTKLMEIAFGPRGRYVIINQQSNDFIFTRSGSTIIKSMIQRENTFEETIVQLIKKMSYPLWNDIGDGVKTTFILTKALLEAGIEKMAKGVHPVTLKAGLEKGVREVEKTLSQLVSPVQLATELEKMLFFWSDGDAELSKRILSALQQVGKEGVITVKQQQEEEETSLDQLQVNSGYLSPYFVTQAEAMCSQLDYPYILLFNDTLSSANQVLPFLEIISQHSSPCLLVFVESIAEEVLTTLILNQLQRDFSLCVVAMPPFNNEQEISMEEIAIITGGRVVTKEVMETLSEQSALSYLGRSTSATITEKKTMIYGGKGKKEERTKQREELCQKLKTASCDEREKRRRKLAYFCNNVTTISMHSDHLPDCIERQKRGKKALKISQTALREGIVPGGGLALLRSMEQLQMLDFSEDENAGKEILFKALLAPVQALANNSNKDTNEIIQKTFSLSGNQGYDVVKGEFLDLVEEGIVEPFSMTINALKQASHFASLFFTTTAIVSHS